MKIAIDCDDAGVNLKKIILTHVKNKGRNIVDLDYVSTKANAYYPEIGYNLAMEIQAGKYDRGMCVPESILIGRCKNPICQVCRKWRGLSI
jgi:ribose 5-phosphate isomerase B